MCLFVLRGNVVRYRAYLLVDCATAISPGRPQNTLFLFDHSCGPWLFVSCMEICVARLQSFAQWTLGYSDNGFDAARLHCSGPSTD